MTGYQLLGQLEVESPEWYAARQNRLGGSEIAAVLGLSPYESRFSLWHRKKGTVGPQASNPEMDWGRRLEAPVLRKFMENHPRFLRVLNATGVFVNNDRPYQLASPDDRVINDDGQFAVVEIKTSPFGEGWGKAGTDEIPPYYQAQVQWYLDCFGYDIAYVAVLISGFDYREYTVMRNDSDILILREAADQFIVSLNRNERPDVDGHDQTYAAIKELHPEIDGTKVDVDPQVAADFVETKQELAVAELEHARARSVLADEMGEAHSAWCNGFKIADRRVRGDGRPYIQAVGSKQLPNPNQLRTAS